MIQFDSPPVPNLVLAWDDEDNAEFFPVGTGRTKMTALIAYFEHCLDIDPSYTNDSIEFACFWAD